MRIKGLSVTGLSGMPDREFDLDAGCCAVIGGSDHPAELVLYALMIALYGAGTPVPEGFRQCFAAAKGCQGRIKVLLELDGGTEISVARSLAHDSVEVKVKEGGRFVPARPGEWARLVTVGLGGTPERFMESLVMTAEEVERARISRLGGLLAAKLTGVKDGRAYEEAIRWISDRISENPRPDEAFARVAELSRELDAARDACLRLWASQDRLQWLLSHRKPFVEDKIDALSAGPEEGPALLEAIARADAAQKDLAEAEAILGRAQELREALKDVRSELAQYSGRESVFSEENVCKLGELNRRTAEFTAKISELQARATEMAMKVAELKEDVRVHTAVAERFNPAQFAPEVLEQLEFLTSGLDERELRRAYLADKLAEVDQVLAGRKFYDFMLATGASVILLSVGNAFLSGGMAKLTTSFVISLFGVILGAFMCVYSLIRMAGSDVSPEVRERIARELAGLERQIEWGRQQLDEILKGQTKEEFLADYDAYSQAAAAAAKARAELAGAVKAQTEADNELNLARLEMKHYRDELMAELRQAGASSYAEFCEMAAKYRAAKEKEAALTAALSDVLGGREFAEFEDHVMDLMLAAEQAKAEVAALGGEAEEQRVRKLKEQRESALMEAQRYEEEVRLLQEEIDGCSEIVRSRGPWEVACDLDVASEEAEEAEMRSEALALARSLIAASIEEIQRAAVAFLGPCATGLLRLMAPDLQAQVSFSTNGGQIEPVLEAGRHGATIPCDRLGSREYDACLLALRLAIADYLTGSSGAPVLLMGAFDGYETQRLVEVCEIVEAVARARQVIWLTSDARIIPVLGEDCRVEILEDVARAREAR